MHRCATGKVTIQQRIQDATLLKSQQMMFFADAPGVVHRQKQIIQLCPMFSDCTTWRAVVNY